MSVFSEQLNEVIQKGHYTLPYLENESGFSVALISKIKTGKRLPDSEEKMLRLVKSLHLPLEQEEMLMKEYHIEKFGREKYLRMEECKKTLETISTRPAFSWHTQKMYDTVPDQQVIHGLVNINAMVQYMIDTEKEKQGGLLKMIIQPDYTFIKDYLLSTVSVLHHSTFTLEHIVALCGSSLDSASPQNMQAAGFCFQLSSQFNKNYQVYFHYKTDFTSDLFPFCILTSQFGMLISADYQTALFYHESDSLTALTQTFLALKEKCQPLLKALNSPVEYLQSYEVLYAGSHPVLPCIELSYSPCILHDIPPEAAMRRIHPELAKSPYIMKFLKQYWQSAGFEKTISIFSLNGLDTFMNTGICCELPKNSHSPFSLGERVETLKKFRQSILQGKLIPVLLKDSALNITSELSLYIYNNTDMHFLWNLQEVPFSSCTIQERTIRNDFLDFMNYLLATEKYTYSQEESLEMLKKFLRHYF